MLLIFLATYNRLQTLVRTLDSYRRLSTPYELVVVDNGTDHPASFDLLTQVEQRPDVRKVYSLPKVKSMQELTNHFNIAIRDQYRRSDSKGWFAVTDADISFESTHPEALSKYVRLARRTGFAVGPHTRVDASIPSGYPLRSRVLACESRLLYRRSMNWLDDIPYSHWAIDTTFHLFPRVKEFRRLKMNTVRCGPPYDAMHLDWYVDVHSPTEENAVYLTEEKPPGVGSWGSGWLRGFWLDFMESPERAYEGLLREPRNRTDLCNVSFMLSWCLQYGLGVEQHQGRSLHALRRAVPSGSVWWPLRRDWAAMIYEQDFSALGWPIAARCGCSSKSQTTPSTNSATASPNTLGANAGRTGT